jgi:hypothetical protein
MAPPFPPSRALSSVRLSAPKPPRRDRVYFLFRLELVAGRVVVRKGGAEALRRAHGVGHGDRRPELGLMAGVIPLSPGMNGDRPILDQRPRLELTPSRGKIHKEPLGFWII